MKRIGVISDTHGYWDEQIENFFTECHEIWHAGDIGGVETANRISEFKTLRAVYGNIDDFKVRSMFPKIERFSCENVDVLMTHIGGYPNKYDSQILPIIKNHPPNLFICGHSHILKVIYDKKYELLHINPGAIGNSGFHNLRTAVRFTIDSKEIKDLEILEIPRQGH